MLTSVRFGPQDHGRVVSDDALQGAEFRSGYDYEVIFGRLYVSPAPNFKHDWIEKYILEELVKYWRQHPEVLGYVTDRARVFVPGMERTTAPEPDLAVYTQMPVSDWHDASPLIVGEVLRGEDVDKDLFRSVDLYLRVPSIQEYWVFDIRKDVKRPSLLIHKRDHDDWNLVELGPDAIYETPWLPGLKLRISPPQ